MIMWVESNTHVIKKKTPKCLESVCSPSNYPVRTKLHSRRMGEILETVLETVGYLHLWGEEERKSPTLFK